MKTAIAVLCMLACSTAPARSMDAAMTITRARALVEEAIRRDGGRVVIVDDLTQEQDFGWVFFVNGPAWVKSRDVRDAVPGAGVFIVDRDDGSVHVGGSRPPAAFIAQYRNRRSAVRLTISSAMVVSAIGDDLTIDLTIENRSSAPVDVDGWLAVGDGVTFDVRGPDGNARPLTRRDSPRRVTRQLAPGETLQTSIDLSHHVDVETVGRYQVTAMLNASSVASQPLGFERTSRISQRGSHSELFYGMQALDQARAKLAEQLHDDAVLWARRGLRELSAGYHPRHAPADATPLAISKAEADWKAGDASAPGRLVDALETRVQEFQTRHHHPNLAWARGDHDMATAALASGNISLALVRARSGLDHLGGHYAPDDVVDDTGLKILAANERERAGAPADAAQVLTRILASRIQLYERRWRDEL